MSYNKILSTLCFDKLQNRKCCPIIHLMTSVYLSIEKIYIVQWLLPTQSNDLVQCKLCVIEKNRRDHDRPIRPPTKLRIDSLLLQRYLIPFNTKYKIYRFNSSIRFKSFLSRIQFEFVALRLFASGKTYTKYDTR